jgi:hypothetical protein
MMSASIRLRSSWPLRAAALCLLSAALPGCPDDESEPVAPTCDDRFTGRALAGDWTLTGSGQRSECDSRRLDGALKLSTAMPIAVEAAAQATTGPASGPEPMFEADAFVNRIERADYLLTLSDAASDEVADSIALQGGVNGSCVSFDLTEALPGGDEIDYHFDGYIVGSNRAQGDFFGTGPGECVVEGQFDLVVR